MQNSEVFSHLRFLGNEMCAHWWTINFANDNTLLINVYIRWHTCIRKIIIMARKNFTIVWYNINILQKKWEPERWSDVFKITELLSARQKGGAIMLTFINSQRFCLGHNTLKEEDPLTCYWRLVNLRYHSRPCLLRSRDICSSSGSKTLDRLLHPGHDQCGKATYKFTRKELKLCSFLHDAPAKG